MSLDFTDWELAAIDNRPDDAYEITLPDLTATTDSDIAHLDSALPEMPAFDPKLLVTASAFTTSGSSAVFSYVARVGDLPTSPAQQYSASYVASYNRLQASYQRALAVRSLVVQVCSIGTVARFDAASNAMSHFRLDPSGRRGAAIQMRNLLDGIQGDLLQRARTKPGEALDWAAMVSRVSKGGGAGPQCSELAAQGPVRSALVSRLSDVAKDREGGSATNLEVLWTEVLDHVFSVLGLVQAP